MGAPRKAWRELSTAYRKRLERKGINAKNYRTAEGQRLRTAARGHSKTPEHPERAEKHPTRYPDYVQTGADETRQLIARKERIFGDRHKFRTRGSEGTAKQLPRTGERPRRDLVRRFLRMSEAEVDAMAARVGLAAQQGSMKYVEWEFMFYH